MINKKIVKAVIRQVNELPNINNYPNINGSLSDVIWPIGAQALDDTYHTNVVDINNATSSKELAKLIVERQQSPFQTKVMKKRHLI